MKRLSVLLSLSLAIAVGAAFAAPAAQAKTTRSSSSLTAIPVTGTDQNGNTVNGLLTITQVSDVNQTVSGTLDVGGIVDTFVADIVSLVNVGPAGSCQILDLTLGPLDLDLLGLVVHLDVVHLNITAQRGPGNLLGNLLCGLVGILNP